MYIMFILYNNFVCCTCCSERRRRCGTVVKAYGKQAGEGEESRAGQEGRPLAAETRKREAPGATLEVVTRLIAHGQVFNEFPVSQEVVNQKHVSNNRIMYEKKVELRRE